MVWPRSLPKSSNHWLASPTPHHQHPRLCGTSQADQTGTWRMPQFLWCVCCLHLSPHRSCPQYHQGSIGQGHHPQGKNCYGSWRHYPPIGVLSQEHLPFFQDQFYEQVEGAAMGSPVSPIVANIYMEYLEQNSLSTAPHPPRFWCRFVDDTLSSTRKPTYKASFNTSTVLTLP